MCAPDGQTPLELFNAGTMLKGEAANLAREEVEEFREVLVARAGRVRVEKEADGKRLEIPGAYPDVRLQCSASIIVEIALDELVGYILYTTAAARRV